MEIDLTAFHFLRPVWLWLLLPALLLPLAWLRRNDVRVRWRGLIEPALLEHLIVGETKRRALQPVHALGLLLGIGALAAAGPTWQQERPPFEQDKAPMVVVLELARSMDATDVAPTRLERARQKVLDLARARPGARTGLVVFAATGHLVVPPTADPAMLDLYVPALAPSLMPRDGKNATAGLDVADRLLAGDAAEVALGASGMPASGSPATKSPGAGSPGAGSPAAGSPAAGSPVGTIVFISDGFDTDQIDAFVQKARSIRHQLLWLAVGAEDGAPQRGPDGRIEMDAQGRPLVGSFDAAAIRKVADQAGIPLASLRADDDDIVWVQHRAQAWFEEAQASKIVPRWKESGYWLLAPLLLLALWSFRRGWTVRWLAAVLLSLTLYGMPHEAQAAGWRWIDLFATHDQQGRWAFERGDYKAAAQRFDDPMWKGRAHYLAGDYSGALASFSRLKSAEAYFYMGNSFAFLDDYAAAIKAYDNALQLQPGLHAAIANRALLQKLLAQNNEDESDPDQDQPDQVQVDKKKGRGTTTVIVGAPRPSEDMWMRNLTTSPAVFLQQRFAQESDAKAPVAP
ncbi:VWA domain-containing protein [Paraburkholderia sp. BCC1886]|uniref:VWA domain-containing protein n=1 Tax=Paraburkholderia sp. BCC1886 TaxID=2562670 RepID=UPI001183DFD8|nr:VWA domain-containing protein [Paraburkholderia sp. BCC1886]